MNEISKKFSVYARSSFSEPEKKELYDYIWKTWGRKISFYISNVVPPGHSDFDDLFQDVMLRIYKNLHTFNPHHSFKAWIYTIVRNRCLDFLKNKDNKGLAELKRADLDKAAAERAPAETDPETRLIRKDLSSKIDRFLFSLDPVEREISFLHFYEGLSYKEIADVVDLNANSVKSKVHWIKQKCRNHLKR